MEDGAVGACLGTGVCLGGGGCLGGPLEEEEEDEGTS